MRKKIAKPRPKLKPLRKCEIIEFPCGDKIKVIRVPYYGWATIQIQVGSNPVPLSFLPNAIPLLIKTLQRAKLNKESWY